MLSAAAGQLSNSKLAATALHPRTFAIIQRPTRRSKGPLIHDRERLDRQVVGIQVHR
jgi:hypothetical protein